MGYDFRNQQVHAHGDEQPQVVDFIRQHFFDNGYTASASPVERGRSIAVCFTDQWVTVLDSAGTEWEEMDEFRLLAEALSSKWPVVVVEMSDSAALTLSLHIDRKMVDRYQSLKPPFFAFKSDEEAQMVRGDPLMWSRIFNAPSDSLRSIWRQGLDSRPQDILLKTGRLLGWHPLLCQVGYTIDNDGCPVDFDEHYSDVLDQLSDVERLHFQKKGG